MVDIFLRKIHRWLQGEGYLKYDIMMSNIYFVDSLLVSRLIHPERYYHNMKTMCQLYNIIDESSHRAMGDVNALTELWKHLIKKLQSNKQEISGTNLRYLTYCG